MLAGQNTLFCFLNLISRVWHYCCKFTFANSAFVCFRSFCDGCDNILGVSVTWYDDTVIGVWFDFIIRLECKDRCYFLNRTFYVQRSVVFFQNSMVLLPFLISTYRDLLPNHIWMANVAFGNYETGLAVAWVSDSSALWQGITLCAWYMWYHQIVCHGFIDHSALGGWRGYHAEDERQKVEVEW